MTIRITHSPGVADWPCGATVEVEDRRAHRLVALGYAEQVVPVAQVVVEKVKRKGKE